MANEFDKFLEKERKDYFEKSKEINDFMNSLFSSNEIKKIIRKYNIKYKNFFQGPLFYTSSKEGINNIKLGEYGATPECKKENYFDKFLVERRGTSDNFYFNKVREKYKGGNCSYCYNKISKDSSKLEKNEFLSELASQYMKDGGFIYDSNKKIITPHLGKKIKKVTKISLENSIVEYFMKPIFDHSKI